MHPVSLSNPGAPQEGAIDIHHVENSIRNLNIKNRQELRDLFSNPREHIATYELNEENLQIFRRLRKFRSSAPLRRRMLTASQ